MYINKKRKGSRSQERRLRRKKQADSGWVISIKLYKAKKTFKKRDLTINKHSS